MPLWKTIPVGDLVRHELDGARYAAEVCADPARGVTVISVGLAVDGTDESTVERCKRRAEELLAAGLRP